jgi:H(+)-transporting ATP synthase subunit D
VSAQLRTPATRHALQRLRRRFERVQTASKLLARKRKALVDELLRTTRPAIDARHELERRATAAFATLVQAEGDRGHALLAALALPGREIGVELRATRTWGVVGAEIVDHDPVRRSTDARGTASGSAGPAAAAAAAEFEELIERVLEAASRELLARRLARALAETTRRVNLLERRVAPGLAAEVARVESTLQEREREEQLHHRRLLSRNGPA